MGSGLPGSERNLQIKPRQPAVAPAFQFLEGAGEVQEKPAPARVGGEDADCQRGSECQCAAPRGKTDHR